MNNIFYLTFSFFFFSSSLTAQWLSVEGAMGPGSSKILQETEVLSGDNIFGILDGMDTLYVRSQFSGRSINQKKISNTLSVRGALKMNFPVIPRLTASTGLGLEITSFDYRDVTEITDFTWSRDTLWGYRPTSYVYIAGDGGGGGTSPGETEDGEVCDTLVRNEFSPSSPSHVFTTRNNIVNLVFPLELSYDIIPNNLSLRVGAHFNFSFDKTQKYSETIRAIDYFTSTPDHIVCFDSGRTVSNYDSDVLATVSVTAFTRIELPLDDRFRAFVSFSTALSSITNPKAKPDDSTFAIAYNYRPVMLRLGLSLDLIQPKNYQKRKTNYLIKANKIEF